MNVPKKPLKTTTNWLNQNEMLKFKEQTHFITWKDKTHFYFDKIWYDAKILSREETYKWLAKKLNVSEEKAHIRFLNKEQCSEAVWFCQQLLNDNRRCDLDFGTNPITPFYIL